MKRKKRRCNATVNEPLDASQRQLAEDNLLFAQYMARPFKRKYPELGKDIEAAAYLGLILAARNFDEDRDITFITYSRGWIRGSIINEIRRFNRLVPHEHVHQPSPDRDDPRRQILEREAAETILRKLPPKIAESLRQTVLENLTQKQAAKKLATTQGQIHKYKTMARKLLTMESPSPSLGRKTNPQRETNRP